MPIAAAAIMGGSSLASSGLGAAQSGKAAGSPKIPKVFRDQVLKAMEQISLQQATRTPYGYQRTAPLDPMQLAAMGGIAKQALLQGAPQPTTSATQGGNYWQQAMGQGQALASGSPMPPGTPQMAQGAPQGQGMPQGGQGMLQAPQTQMANGQAGYNPYANLALASGFIEPLLSPLFQATPTSPLIAPPEWSQYYGNTPAGQAAQVNITGDAWAKAHPDKAGALNDPAWVASHPKKAAEYSQKAGK